ncbi:hypothetical protein LSTR_LSTR013938 [Laodelphax striatellus]|uniref:Uncharacterized protein n=1 Tax=Laodelphax striatellus TaxID=195883 RepID=A0A482WSJ9_LAOST|nr:hypothetical protein LSTR_LSTR013938 [Laodelphax striatellus]
MSFTRAFAVNDGNATMTLDDSVTNNCKNATNFTMDAGTDEEMRRLMQEVEMEETLDSEKLKSYRLSDVSFLVRENLVSGKSKRANKRRSSIATTSSNSPIDLSVTSNRFGQKNIDEEEEGEEEEEEEMEVEEERRGEKDESRSETGEKRNEKASGEESKRLKEEEYRRRREESDGLGKEEECERERRSDLKEDIERKGLEEGGEELEEERPEDRRAREDGRLEEESARQRKESNEDGGRGREEADVEEKDDVDKMETDAEIQGGRVNDLDMSIVDDNEEVTNGVKNKDKSGSKEETLHLNLKEETLCSREETLSKKTEETFCLNLNSVSEMVECSVARDDEREEKECDEGGVKEDGTGSGKEQSADNQSTRSNVVLSTGHEEQLLQENTRNKRKSDSLDLSREELDVVESPSKLARMDAVTSPAITSDAPTVTSEEQPPNSTPEINANSATSRISLQIAGKRSSSSHSLDETCMSFSEMRESLEWNSSLNNSTRLSGAFSASTSAPTPLFYVQEEVAPHKTRYSFYEGAMVVRAERKSGATEQLKAAEISVDTDAKQPCLIFANKIKTLFAEKVVACQSMSEVKEVISEINDFAFQHETNYKSLLRLWYNGRFEKIVNGRLKYVAICSGTMTWFTVFIDPDIIFESLSDDAITVKQWVGEVQDSYIKHLYRCCIRSPDRLKDFTDAIENYVNTPKT